MKVNLLFNYQFRCYLSRLEKREGIGSKIYAETDKHILLWDFDDAKLSAIILTLLMSQKSHSLPTIYIVSSSPKKYHAYCFTARPFREVIHIISEASQIDVKYLRLGMIRGYYTLRISTRRYDSFKLIEVLKSSIPDEVDPADVSISEYMTTNKGGKNAKR